MSTLLQELETRFGAMFRSLADGDDVAPAVRLRCEGLMEAAVLCGDADAEAVDELLKRSFEAAFGRPLCEFFGPRWREFFPYPQIPAVMQRAPVYPSTGD